jgi:hypothetical protein
MRTRIAAGVLCALVLAAGLLAVDARRAHDAASLVLEAVETRVAGYDPGEWKDTVFVLLIGSDERPGLDGARGDALHVVGLLAARRSSTSRVTPGSTSPATARAG